MKLLLVIDIDGTLARIKERSKNAGSMPPRHKRHLFQMWLDKLQRVKDLAKDKPIKQNVLLVQVLSRMPGVVAVYLTGRSEKYRSATEAWLVANGCPVLPLHMRQNRDWRSARAYKKEQMLALIKKHRATEGQVLVIDDDGDGDCSAMYLRLKAVHLKVIS